MRFSGKRNVSSRKLALDERQQGYVGLEKVDLFPRGLVIGGSWRPAGEKSGLLQRNSQTDSRRGVSGPTSQSRVRTPLAEGIPVDVFDHPDVL